MNDRLIALLRCPICGGPLERPRPDSLECAKAHAFRCDGPYIVFAKDPDEGRYNKSYSERYAFLWAYGYETRHSGLVESLYRSAAALIAEALAETGKNDPVVVDFGCGTGRTIADAAGLTPAGSFVGLDLSSAKLDLAARIVRGPHAVESTLPGYGFPDPLTIRGRGLTNVILAQADALKAPVADNSADLVVCVNLLDRVEDPRRVLQEARRVLRSGGALILTTPLNWDSAELWNKYPGASALLAVLEGCGFSVRTWFDQLLYREILDARGSVEEFATLVVSGRAL